MTEHIKSSIEFLSVAIEAVAAFLIALAVLPVIVRSLQQYLPRRSDAATRMDAVLESRLTLGRWLALGLELTLAADILRTAVAPTWDEIGKLAAIATLRTALNYFLEREVRREEQTQTARPRPRDE
ncbi:MAG TPA: DUF1622 domain-containing protein [Bryobacteraceae bacterium]|nr:DUF1622 domain-containing protein [Bryobacteraceae bacterium]